MFSSFSKGWLEPLLHRIKEDDSVIAIPQNDVIRWDTFEVRKHLIPVFESEAAVISQNVCVEGKTY